MDISRLMTYAKKIKREKHKERRMRESRRDILSMGSPTLKVAVEITVKVKGFRGKA